MNLPMYGVIKNGIFGYQIVSGIITGIRYTEEDPVYEISYGSNKWWVSKIADNKEDLFELLNIASLSKIKATHGLKIKFER